MKQSRLFAVGSYAAKVLGAGAIFLAMQAQADYSEHPAGIKLINKMVDTYGADKDRITHLLANAKKQQSILDLISRPAEKTKPWFEYRKIFLGQKRIDKGVNFWKKHQQALNTASEKYGVPQEIIVAIIGVETRYGGYMGSHRVIDALATLGFDYPKRAPFFVKELEHFLLLTQEQKQDPLALKGSYAGAMGFGQFMPSSYRAYAVDFDDDGKADIWENPTDAIGSVANYFRAHRWQTGEPVMAKAIASDKADSKVLDSRKRPSLLLEKAISKGYTLENTSINGKAVALDTKVLPLAYDIESGKEYWLGFDNFYVITRYNRSHMYARAVWELSQEIKSAYLKNTQVKK